jgi:hypothetical protein
MLSARGKCCLIRYSNGVMHTDVHEHPLALVLALLNSGIIGTGSHGSVSHLLALREVAGRAQELITKIVNAEDVGE